MTAPSDVFRDSKLKIERANQHILELNTALNEFIGTDFYSLGVAKDPQTGNHVLKFGITKSLPERLPLIIGDALHNLRSALDFIASELVRRANGSMKYIKFPIRDTRKEVEAALLRGEIRVAHPDVITCILDEIKPYKGGNDALCALHDLDIADKHLLLIPVVSVAALTHVHARAGNSVFEDCTFTVIGGRDSNILAMPKEFQMQGQGQPVFTVVFG
ncbi:MAG: hypothetical protein ABSH05_04015 [Bryobacteraceae bacterium]|jgi:hypothetical protein